MLERILCPFHKEKTPSCVLYEERYHCYGCGKNGPLEELPGEYHAGKQTKRKKTNIFRDLAYIRDLPRHSIRGLSLPCDDSFYYIVWPSGDYYTKRHRDLHSADSKYLCPSGHSRPLFIPKRGTKGLLVVEGEINALSAAEVLNDWTICSPGGTSLFAKHLTFFKQFDTVVVAVDKDIAGFQAIQSLHNELSGQANFEYYMLPKDFNDILVQHGKQTLRKQLKEKMGL